MKIVALDYETRLISSDEISPTPVCLGVWDSKGGQCLVKNDMKAEMKKHLEDKDSILVFHNAKFDMLVTWVHFPELRELIWEAYSQGRVKCTQIRERLYTLSTLGSLTQPKGYFSLADSVERRLGIDLSHWKTGVDVWRLRYAELEEVPLSEWPSEAVEYVKSDCEHARELYLDQESFRKEDGIGSMGGELLQTLSDFCLGLMTVRGIEIDPVWVGNIVPEIENGFLKGAQLLKEEGVKEYKRYKKSGKAKLFRKEHRTGKIYKDCPENSDFYLVPYFQPFAYENKDGSISLKEKLLKQYIGDTYPGQAMLTDTGDVSIKAESLNLVNASEDDMVIHGLKELKEWQKLMTSFVPRLKAAAETGSIHPDYNALMETGRTSSFGGKFYPSHNIQQMPRKGKIREAHVPRKGKKFGAFDYDSLELRAFAQACFDLFGHSTMLDLINQGMDVHAWMGAKLLGLDESRVVSYDEMTSLLAGDKGDALKLRSKHYRQMAKAANFGFPGGLGASKFLEYLASYGVKGISLAESYKIKNAFYDAFPEVRKFFDWHKLQEDAQGYWHYDTMGRWRAKCGYANAANGILLQSLSSDGAKIALIRLTYECEFGRLKGSSMLAFIHDEFILEIDEDKVDEHSQIIMEIMVDSMHVVMPEVAIGVGGDIMDRWLKDDKQFLKSFNFSKGAPTKELV